jgi:diadenosine tetraphosphate (Ap4A) HIT family hydrolase
MDIRPINPGYVLVIPAIHTASLAKLDAESGAHLFRIGQRVALALRTTEQAWDLVMRKLLTDNLAER